MDGSYEHASLQPRAGESTRLEVGGSIHDARVPRRKLRQEAQHVKAVRLIHAGREQHVPRKARAVGELDGVGSKRDAAVAAEAAWRARFSTRKDREGAERAYPSSVPAAEARSSASSAAWGSAAAIAASWHRV